jgi:hypothetical protein
MAQSHIRGRGDAAAAFVFGPGDSGSPVIARVLAHASTTGEFLDRWRLPGARASRAWEERFGKLDRASECLEKIVALDEAFLVGGLQCLAYAGLGVVHSLVRGIDTLEARLEGIGHATRRVVLLPRSAVQEVGYWRLSLFSAHGMQLASLVQ